MYFFYHKIRKYVVIIDWTMQAQDNEKKYVISVFMFPLEFSFTKATIFIIKKPIKTCQQKQTKMDQTTNIETQVSVYRLDGRTLATIQLRLISGWSSARTTDTRNLKLWADVAD